MSAETIIHRARTGRLVRLHRGVYALGHRALKREGRWIAAVLWCGPGAVLSHRSAAALWGLRASSGIRFAVSVPTGNGRRRRQGLEVHRVPTLRDSEVTIHDAIPVTTPARTLLDLAAVLPIAYLRRAVEQAHHLDLLDREAVGAVLAAHPRQAGAPALAALLRELGLFGIARTRSDLEAMFLQLCLDHGLPRPRVNHHDNGRELDFHWPGSALVVEVDGWHYHRSRIAFGADRRRDRLLLRDGRHAVRYTGDEVEQTPAAVAAELRELLALFPRSA